MNFNPCSALWYISWLPEVKLLKFSVLPDDFCKEFEAEMTKCTSIHSPCAQTQAKRMMPNAEVITILICFHFNPFRNFKHYYKPSHTTVLSRLCQDVLLCISRTRVNNKPLVTKQFLKQNKNTPIYLLFQNKKRTFASAIRGVAQPG